MLREDKKRLRKLDKILHEIDIKFKAKLKLFKEEGKSQREIHDLGGAILPDRCIYIDEKDEIITKDLMKNAIKYDILVSDRDNSEIWQDNMYGDKVLTNKGRILLQKDITREKREHHKLLLLYISTITGFVIGLIGATTGLLSVIMR